MARRPEAHITGRAYGRPASIEVTGTTVTWRARPDGAENIVTTIHEIAFARWHVQRTSWIGLTFAGLGVVWTLGAWYLVGGVAFAAALTLIARRVAQPRRLLVLEVGANQLELEVDAGSAAAAKQLVTRIERVIVSGETPSTPPTLP
jgi:hypothetical protein